MKSEAEIKWGRPVRRFASACRRSDELTQFAGRAYHRILKLERTIADLAGSDEIQSAHLAEVLQYRPKLMMG